MSAESLARAELVKALGHEIDGYTDIAAEIQRTKPEEITCTEAAAMSMMATRTLAFIEELDDLLLANRAATDPELLRAEKVISRVEAGLLTNRCLRKGTDL